VKKAAAELKTKLDDQATDLDQKWTEKLRYLKPWDMYGHWTV